MRRLSAKRPSLDDRNLLSWALNGMDGYVRECLEKGAGPNARDSDGRTPLHCAAHSGSLATVEMLLAAGSEANAMDDFGDTPLALAARKSGKEMLEALLGAGAQLETKNDAGVKPL